MQCSITRISWLLQGLSLSQASVFPNPKGTAGKLHITKLNQQQSQISDLEYTGYSRSHSNFRENMTHLHLNIVHCVNESAVLKAYTKEDILKCLNVFFSSVEVMPSSHCTILVRFFTRLQVLINRNKCPTSEANWCAFTRVTIAQCELSKRRSEGIADASPTPDKYLAG